MMLEDIAQQSPTNLENNVVAGMAVVGANVGRIILQRTACPQEQNGRKMVPWDIFKPCGQVGRANMLYYLNRLVWNYFRQ